MSAGRSEGHTFNALLHNSAAAQAAASIGDGQQYVVCNLKSTTSRLHENVPQLNHNSPRLPKKKKLVSSLQTSPFLNISCALKYTLNGVMICATKECTP